MKKVFAVTAALALLGLTIAAQADVFNLGPGLTNLDTVAVGDPGNAADTRYQTPGYGSVAYNYNIGKYEVTAGQYTAFLNAVAATDTYGLYSAEMGSTPRGCNIQRSGTPGSYTYSVANNGTDGYWANRPVNCVSYWDACRFANWLSNGQGDGDTEHGMYALDSYNGQNGRSIGRNPGWGWAVTSEDEWYKAAYYKGGGTNAGYWEYAMQSDISTTPSNDLTEPDGGNNANFYYNGYTIGDPYYRTNVGEFENSASAYGTFDQSGNVFEWNEAIVRVNGDLAYRGNRGGSFENVYSSYDWLGASGHIIRDSYPTIEFSYLGFRVSQVPEPSSIVALLGGLVSLLGIRRRRA